MIRARSQYRIPDNLKGTILAQIMSTKLVEVAGSIRKLPADSLQQQSHRFPELRSLRQALLRRRPAIIAEVKRASPSAGLLREDFDPVKIALEYQKEGAAAISVITEVHHFRGNLEHLAVLRWNSRVPLLRKDFIFDSYQILESRHAGADAVLLIAAVVGKNELRWLREEAESLGMEALVEVHDEREVEAALNSGASLIGVNSRDLRSFDVSRQVFFRLAPLIPKEVVAVAESGIRTAQDMASLLDAGYRGFLIGEHFLRSPSPGRALSEMLSQVERGAGTPS